MENNFYWNQGPPVNFDESHFSWGQPHSYMHTYTSGWQSHPNFPWFYDVQIPMGYEDQSEFHQDGFDSLESKLDMMLDKLTDKEKCQPRLIEKFEQIKEDHTSSIFNLEMQVRQLSRELCKRRVEDCLRGLNVNSIEPYETLTLRSGQEHIESVDRPAGNNHLKKEGRKKEKRCSCENKEKKKKQAFYTKRGLTFDFTFDSFD